MKECAHRKGRCSKQTGRESADAGGQIRNMMEVTATVHYRFVAYRRCSVATMDCERLCAPRLNRVESVVTIDALDTRVTRASSYGEAREDLLQQRVRSLCGRR